MEKKKLNCAKEEANLYSYAGNPWYLGNHFTFPLQYILVKPNKAILLPISKFTNSTAWNPKQRISTYNIKFSDRPFWSQYALLSKSQFKDKYFYQARQPNHPQQTWKQTKRLPHFMPHMIKDHNWEKAFLSTSLLNSWNISKHHLTIANI
jgi:hypothetical protein